MSRDRLFGKGKIEKKERKIFTNIPFLKTNFGHAKKQKSLDLIQYISPSSPLSFLFLFFENSNKQNQIKLFDLSVSKFFSTFG